MARQFAAKPAYTMDAHRSKSLRAWPDSRPDWRVFGCSSRTNKPHERRAAGLREKRR
jgi:hypothetical protein